MPPLDDPIPAATLVLMRETGRGPPELLMTERTGRMAFAAGALVFPGGRIDAGDHEAAPGDPAKAAAIRETIEETGIAVGLTPPPDAAMVEELRGGLMADRPLADALSDFGLSLELDALTPFARWCPNFRETRRFDTLFFLAEAPADAPAPTIHEAEAVRAFWAAAADILATLDVGQAHAIFPTRRNLERLARFGSIAEARADAALHRVERITPWLEDRGGAPHVCIPEGIGYPVTSEPLETARRR